MGMESTSGGATNPITLEAPGDFAASGVCVQRSLCDKQVLELCFAEIVQGFDRMLALPGPMSASPVCRHFMTIATSKKSIVIDEPLHRRDFRLPLSPAVESLLRAALSGNAGAILVDALGCDAELSALTVIRSEPGAVAQEWHSDYAWSETEPRHCTMFFALHDILEEDMGPTHFCPNTH